MEKYENNMNKNMNQTNLWKNVKNVWCKQHLHEKPEASWKHNSRLGGKTNQPYQQNSCAAIYRTTQQHSMAASSEQRRGGWRRRREGPELVGSHFFGHIFSLFPAAHLCVFTFFLTFCSLVSFLFHSCVFVVFSRFWLKIAIFPDSAPLLGKK